MLMVVLLLAVTVASTWALYRLNLINTQQELAAPNAPDYYMEDFTTVSMDRNGAPDYKLYAVYMAHYPDINTTEVLKPSLELYRDGKLPLSVMADKGWLTAGNEVVVLSGNVVFTEMGADGVPALQINTERARLLISQNYAETDAYASIRTPRTSISGTGMQANLDAGTLSVLSDVRTVIRAN
jgi:lipopolysaccharide export system protein LptC